MYCQRAFSGFATMVFSATGTVRKTWPAAENSSVFRLLWHRHHGTIASATGNSRDRICCNARSARKVRCGGSLFSHRAPQPPDGTAHERCYQLCHCWPRLSCRQAWAEVCLNPVPAAQAVSVSLRRCPFSSVSRIAKHILRAFPISIPSHRDTFSAFSPRP